MTFPCHLNIFESRYQISWKSSHFLPWYFSFSLYLDADLVQSEVLVCCSSQVVKPMWNGRHGQESLSWGVFSLSWVSGAVAISAELQGKQSCVLPVPGASAWSTELLQFPDSSRSFMFFRTWALLLPKLLQLDICKVRILSVGWHFMLEELGTAELIAKITVSRMRTWFLYFVLFLCSSYLKCDLFFDFPSRWRSYRSEEASCGRNDGQD